MTENLVLVEHDGQRIKSGSLHAIAAAREFGGAVGLLALGHDLEKLNSALNQYGASSVYLADDPALQHPLADRYAAVVAEVARTAGSTTLVGSSSTFTKDILPRAAALLDWPMLSDVVAVEINDGSLQYRRPTNWGTGIATVELEGPCRVLTIRPSAFDQPLPVAKVSAVERVSVADMALPSGMRFVSQEERKSDRPELTEARVVVGGGRPLRDKATFDKLICGLADSMGAAVGATRAAVDTGIVPNDWQIGQTGKMIAPELYVAVGISGAVQHLAGVKDARIIVAINKDPDAPICELATYTLIGDLHTIVPELINALKEANDGPSHS